MPTIDLGTRPAAPTPELGALDALPRRVALTLPELQLAAAHAGDAPLPFEVRPPETASAMEGRLGARRSTTEDVAWADAVADLHDPLTTLTRRGLLHEGALDPGLAGALGLLAAPQVAVDLDLTVDGARVRAWHRLADGAVASLATVDGVAFELAWFATGAWPDELARVAVLPEDHRTSDSAVPEGLTLPFELADAAVEVAGTGRPDLLAVLIERYAGAVHAAGRVLDAAETATALAALTSEARGRLRVLVADVSAEGPGTPTVVGVRSWTLLADGWRAVHTVTDDDGTRISLPPVDAVDLPTDLAPVLAEVTA